MAGDTVTEVDDIVSMTSKLGVEQEEDWEENCEAVTSSGGNSLVRKVISKRDIGERLLLNMFGRMWKGITDWEVKVYDEDGDSYVVGFSFKSKKDASVVLSKQPWFFNGGLLILEEWPDTGQWKDFKLEKISCWIKMKGMPLKMFTQKNLQRLGEMAGEIEEFKWHNDRRMFLNGYVRMRIGFPLNRNLFVGRFIPSEGKQHWVQIKFERLSMLCYGCGRWGHEQKECDKPVAMEKDVQGQLVPKYGSWLKEDDPRPNCFVAFKQAQVASASEAYGIDEMVGGERSVRFDRDRGDRSSGNPDERTDGAEVVGELPVGAVLQVVAEHQEIVGNGLEGTRMGLDYIAKESGEGRGLGRDSGLLLKSPYNFNVIDSVEVGRGSQSVGPVDKPMGNSVTINHHQPAEFSDGDVDFKKRKSTGGGSAEELDKGRRYFNKGKQIVEDEGFLTEKSDTVGSRLGHGEGNSKHNGGQRKKVSIKNRARNLAKAAPAVAVNRARGEEMMHPATVGNVAGEHFVFNAEQVVQKQHENSVLNVEHGDDLKIRVDSSSPGHIVAEVAGQGFLPWTLTCFYGHPDSSQRQFSWELLRKICRETHGAWLCVGDFNEIVSLTEKSGGRMRGAPAMEEFKKVLDQCCLMDFSSVKSDFTWCNEHESDTIMERLDRGVCTREWIDQFEGADIQLLDWWESDHRALIVDIPVQDEAVQCGKTKRNTRFHFEEAWCEEEECKEIVDISWKSGERCTSAEALCGKTSRLGKRLHDWNKKKKKDLNRRKPISETDQGSAL
ncbi:hypothetical protein G4B88_011964 [Cannabis sativa]|uniref:CCHC-type domain-containing protein n=1 Tax=Cannabis sativa TaxID=3483 RepID=A0A7J6HEM3_CANSA|nr:hypothetical protein G4B88_011964 [Cannabis sativa]